MGLTAGEISAHRAQYGANVLTDEVRLPVWKRILRLLADRMILVLVVAAVVSAVVSREWETPIVILVVIVLNTVLNYVQESRAENSLAALRTMSVDTSRVRRDVREEEVSNEELVPCDMVLLEAGETVPGDGRILEAARLQVAEAALTGESLRAEKTGEILQDPALPLGDRSNMLFMNTNVSRGRAVLVVTGTGMDAEIGGHSHPARGRGQRENTGRGAAARGSGPSFGFLGGCPILDVQGSQDRYRLQFLQNCKLLPVDGDQQLNLFLRLEIGVEVVLGHGRSDGVLSFGGDEQDRALKSRQHGEQEVQEDVGVRVPGVGRQCPGVDRSPDDHEADEAAHEGPASHPVAQDISGTLTSGQGIFVPIVPGLPSISHDSD